MLKLLCRHPFKYLGVAKEPKITTKATSDFIEITYYLFCQCCGKTLPLKHAKTKYGVKKFLNLKGVNNEH